MCLLALKGLGSGIRVRVRILVGGMRLGSGLGFVVWMLARLSGYVPHALCEGTMLRVRVRVRGRGRDMLGVKGQFLRLTAICNLLFILTAGNG